MMHGVDLEKALQQERRRKRKRKPDQLLDEFKALLAADDALDERVMNNIFGSGQARGKLRMESLDPARIYQLDHIKSICTRFRLRFLDASLFKGEIPYKAIAQIKQLQRSQQVELANFKMVAPAPLFHLKHKDRDPLLFAPLGGGYYYLIHKWGHDLHPLRELAVFPFRNFQSLLGTLAGLALLIVMCIPDSVMMGPYDNSSLGIRAIFFFYLLIAFCGLTALYGFTLMRDFNSSLWDSKYVD